MNIDLIRVPYLGVNDDSCEMVNWYVENNDGVEEGQVIGTVETTKAAIDVNSNKDGYIYLCVEEGAELKENDIIAVLSESMIDESEIKKILDDMEKSNKNEEEIKVTKKAELLAKKNNINLKELTAFAKGNKVNEKTVITFLERKNSADFSRGFCDVERIAIIGGVAGGGALIVIDSILHCNNQQAVVIFDQNEAYHGKSILGVPVAGNIEMLDEYLEEGKVDSVVIAFNKNLQERAKVYQELTDKGVKFTNVIDVSSNLRSKVVIGKGNVILGDVYIGACSRIGNNNFISSNVCLEHGNILESHCAFGPGVITSGNVKINDKVRFGTGIFIEPNVEIGKDSIISSGAILRESVEAGTVVRVSYNQEYSSRKQK